MPSDLKKSLAQLEKLINDINIQSEATSHNEASSFCIDNGSYVRVSEDKMTAWIFVKPDAEGKKYSVDNITSFLKQNGVCRGILSDEIQAISDKGIYNCEVVVAKGRLPKEGRDGCYEYFVNICERRRPFTRPDGTLDYSMAYKLPDVKNGDRLCEYHCAVQGIDGYDVCGNVKPARKCNDLPKLRCRGVIRDENNGIYYAQTDGKLDVNEDRIEIAEVFEVNGDYTGEEGKLEYFGDICICGNVENNAVIRAGRNVFVEGNIKEATVYAGGNIIVAGGISGGENCLIEARGHVMAEFVENASINAQGNVQANYFTEAKVNSKGYVIAEGSNGTITGGNTMGLKGVNANTLGSDDEVITIIRAGYSGETYTKYYDLHRKEIDLSGELTETIIKITEIVGMLRKNPEKSDKKGKELEELNKIKDDCFSKLDNVRFDKKQVEDEIKTGKGRAISVNDSICRGTIISIEGYTFRIPEKTSDICYFCEDGKIVSRALKNE